jgi:general secretion pathway protein K
MPSTVAQLTWFGLDPEAIRALEPHVTMLPGTVPVNVNTASREVLAAVTGLDPATAERIVQQRQRAPFKSTTELFTVAPGIPPAGRSNIAIQSNYFEVRGRLRLGEVVLEQRSVVQRQQGTNVMVLQRERVASRDATGS